jgi:hypothetical protein
LHGRDEVGKAAATLTVVHEREDGLRFAQRDLGRITTQSNHFPRIAFSSCSNPPCSIEQCIPHSFGAFVSHHQRPARSPSPGAIARVQGAQPIDVYPFA